MMMLPATVSDRTELGMLLTEATRRGQSLLATGDGERMHIANLTKGVPGIIEYTFPYVGDIDEKSILSVWVVPCGLDDNYTMLPITCSTSHVAIGVFVKTTGGLIAYAQHSDRTRAVLFGHALAESLNVLCADDTLRGAA